jgi:hypothetical protein
MVDDGINTLVLAVDNMAVLTPGALAVLNRKYGVDCPVSNRALCVCAASVARSMGASFAGLKYLFLFAWQLCCGTENKLQLPFVVAPAATADEIRAAATETTIEDMVSETSVPMAFSAAFHAAYLSGEVMDTLHRLSRLRRVPGPASSAAIKECLEKRPNLLSPDFTDVPVIYLQFWDVPLDVYFEVAMSLFSIDHLAAAFHLNEACVQLRAHDCGTIGEGASFMKRLFMIGSSMNGLTRATEKLKSETEEAPMNQHGLQEIVARILAQHGISAQFRVLYRLDDTMRAYLAFQSRMASYMIDLETISQYVAGCVFRAPGAAWDALATCMGSATPSGASRLSSASVPRNTLPLIWATRDHWRVGEWLRVIGTFGNVGTVFLQASILILTGVDPDTPDGLLELRRDFATYDARLSMLRDAVD